MLFKNLETLIRRGWRLEIRLDSLSPRFHAVIHDNDRGNGHNHVGMTVNQAICGLEQYVGHAMQLDATAQETSAAPHGPVPCSCKPGDCIASALNETRYCARAGLNR
jgi:hypothetical protein